MINLKYSLIIEATKDPIFFTFYSPNLEGFTGVGHSKVDYLYQSKWGIEEYLKLLKERKLPIPKENKNPEIIIRNERKLKVAV